MVRDVHIPLFLLETIFFVNSACGMERFAIYEKAANFDGFSLDVGDVSKRQCAIRYIRCLKHGNVFTGFCHSALEGGTAPPAPH